MSEHWKDPVGFIEVGVVGKREGLRQFMVHGDNWVRWNGVGKMAGFLGFSIDNGVLDCLSRGQTS